MNKFQISFAAGLMAIALSSLASAKDANVEREVTVYYDEVKMASDRDADRLYRKLRTASRDVCGQANSRSLRERAEFTSCYTQALEGAVLKVNRSAVTALHQRATKNANAS